MRPLDVDGWLARLEREYEATLDDGRGEPCEVCGCARCADPNNCEDARRWAAGEAAADAADIAAEAWDAEDVCPI